MYSVIVVEDERMIRNSIVDFINECAEGFNVIDSFVDGREAIQFIKEHAVDVVVTDVKMLDVSGIEIAKYIYENGLHTAVIIISGYKEFSYAQEAMSYNVSNYLTKPISTAELIRALEKIQQMFDREQTRNAEKELPDDRNSTTKEVLTNDDAVMEKALAFIEKNFDKEISLRNVADHVYLSENYFGRLFRSKIKTGFTNYIVSLRINEAKRLLKTGRYTVYEVSNIVGYKNCNYFIKVFKENTGYTPKKYCTFMEDDSDK